MLRGPAGSALFAAADQGAHPLSLLVLTPTLLAAFGREGFGVWSLAMTLLAVSPLASLGASVAATKHVSADLAHASRVEVVASIRAALALALCGGAVAAGVGAVLAPWLAHGVFERMAGAPSLRPILGLSGLAMAVQEIDAVYAGALRGAERFDLAARVEVPMRMLLVTLLMALGARRVEVLVCFQALLGLLCVKALFKGLQVAAHFGSARAVVPSFARAPLLRAARFGRWQWMQSAGTVFFAAADQWLIGGLLGASALTRYSVCLQIAQYVHFVPSALMQVLFPRVSALGPTLSAARGNALLRKSTLIAVGLAAAIGLPLLVCAPLLLAHWVSPAFAADNANLLRVLVAVHVALAFNVAAYYILQGSGRAARSAGIVIVAGAAQSLFALIVAPFGLMAMAFSRFVYSGVTATLYRAARFKVTDGR